MPELEILYYFPPERRFAEDKIAYFANAGFRLMPYGAETLAKEANTVLLFGPIRREERFVSPESVWQRFFALENPKAKLIHYGPRDDAAWHPNYLNRYEPPQDFKGWLANAKAAGDDYQAYSTDGVELGPEWKRFWDGHDKGGFYHWLQRAKAQMRIAVANLEGQHKTLAEVKTYLLEKDNLEAFQYLLMRWQRYREFFKTAPCLSVLEKIDAQLNEVDADWASCQSETELLEKLRAVRQRLLEADKGFEAIVPYFNTLQQQ